MSEPKGLRRAASVIAAVAGLGGCVGDDSAPSADAGGHFDASAPAEAAASDAARYDAAPAETEAPGAGDVDPEASVGDDAAVCQPVPEDRRACRPPLDTAQDSEQSLVAEVVSRSIRNHR
jgi:hypothetical protein